MARIKGPKKIHRYSAEFKLKAVKLSQIEGVQVQDVADALDIHPFMLSRWRKEAREGRLKARVAIAPEARAQRDVRQLAQLKRQYALLKEEHELLKKGSSGKSGIRGQRAPLPSRGRPRRRGGGGPLPKRECIEELGGWEGYRAGTCGRVAGRGGESRGVDRAASGPGPA